MKRTLLATIVACIAILAPVSTAHAADEMGQAKAGKVYLRIICATNDAYDTYSKRVFHGRDRIKEPEVKQRLPELRNLSRALARATNQAGHQLYHPPADWPEDVAGLVDKIADKYVTEAGWRFDASYANNARQWIRYSNKAENVNFGQLSARIRAKLGLPGPGKGCN